LLTLGTPSHFYDLIQYARDHKLTLSESYTAIIGGAKVSVPLWQEIQSVLKIEKPSIGYGATEACPGVTHHPPGLCPKEEGEIGFPIPGVNIILKRDAGIEFSGENVSLAIIENEEIFFPKSIVLEDWIEKRNEDDMLLFRGRLGLLLNRGGTKYSLESIEDCLRKNFGIACAALAVLDERLGEDLGLVIASDTNLDLNHFREKLSAFFLHEYGHSFKLNHITTTRALPLNENGKIDRTQIAKIISAV
jgi:acyl-CoA synthetase (AMP-forming)/AMP-acid ligase II